MRYIDKSHCCQDFDNYINNAHPSEWDEFSGKNKLKLHQHLHQEQGGLCIYCQQQLILKTEKECNTHIRSHIEHIRPRSLYSDLTFDYCNLSISCEGFDCKIPQTNEQPKKEFCEHRKANEYDEEYFLNPIEVQDIEDYFIYDELELEMLPKDKKGTEKFEKAEYMIELLDLNNEKLMRIRQKVVHDIEKTNELYEKHDTILLPFYSMLAQLNLLP